MVILCSSRVCNSRPKSVFSLARKLDSELGLRMSFSIEFQTFGAATQNARLAVSVRVHGTESIGGPQRPRRHLEFIDVRRNGSRQSLMRVDRYFVLDALLDRQPVKRL